MSGLRVRRKLKLGTKGRKSEATEGEESQYTGRVPRISKLMALAIRFDGLLRNGLVKNHAELAELGHVTRPRVTQIMNLLNLAPDIQEQILFLPLVTQGKDPITERDMRLIAGASWTIQRVGWQRFHRRCETVET